MHFLLCWRQVSADAGRSSLIRCLNFQEKAHLSFWIYDYNYRYGSFKECNGTSGAPKPGPVEVGFQQIYRKRS